jgi:hypothetical protein
MQHFVEPENCIAQSSRVLLTRLSQMLKLILKDKDLVIQIRHKLTKTTLISKD